MKWLPIFLFAFCFPAGSCTRENVLTVPLKDLNEENFRLSELCTGKKGIVLVFLAPDCPLSQFYSLPLRNFFNAYGEQVAFAGIIPGNHFNTGDIRLYKERYQLPFELLLDEQMKLTRKLNATITPEVFLLDENREVIYSGAIDDAAVDLTIKRQVVTGHYLKNAVESLLNHQQVSVKKTKAVGCIIERGK